MLLLVAVRTMQALTRPYLLISLIVYAIPQTHSMLGYCGTFSCVVCTFSLAGMLGEVCASCSSLRYGTCRHLVMTTVPSLQERPLDVKQHLPCTKEHVAKLYYMEHQWRINGASFTVCLIFSGLYMGILFLVHF